MPDTKTLEQIVFYGVGGSALAGALCVVLLTNPIYCALCLAMTMTGLAAIYYALGAHFVAGVQLIVYAGAVMVLFVMVVMLFDLKKELEAFSKGMIAAVIKMAAIGAALGFVIGGIELTQMATQAPPMEEGLAAVKEMSFVLFNKYVFGFEVISILLLVVIVGAVSVARSRGGTHA